METINVKVNGIDVQVAKGAKILDAAKKAGVVIPTLCAHSDIEPWAACGMCVVKVADSRGVSPKLVRACATEVVEGQNYITHDSELQSVRKTVLEMTLADHPSDCFSCIRNNCCELQTLAAEFGIREIPFERNIHDLPKDDSSPSIIL